MDNQDIDSKKGSQTRSRVKQSHEAYTEVKIILIWSACSCNAREIDLKISDSYEIVDREMPQQFAIIPHHLTLSKCKQVSDIVYSAVIFIQDTVISFTIHVTETLILLYGQPAYIISTLGKAKHYHSSICL